MRAPFPSVSLDHVTVSRTRRLIDAETHQRVFGWVLEQLARAGLIRSKTIGVDATTLEANAAMRSIGRRDRAKGTPSICGAWRRPRGWRGPRRPRCGGWTGCGPSRPPTPRG